MMLVFQEYDRMKGYMKVIPPQVVVAPWFGTGLVIPTVVLEASM